jgi:formiminotetrahydrofolate cyclodeaminase
MGLIDLPVSELLTKFSSPDPTPGGGSASALASSIGASLLMMVAGLPKTRSGSDEDRQALASAAAALGAIRQELVEAVDADSAAYDQVVAAYKRPKASDEEQRARKAAIQIALHAATDVPLLVMRLSALALGQTEIVAAHGNRSASSDIGVAIALLMAGTAGAMLNVDVNLDTIVDAAYRDAVRLESRTLMQAVGDAAERAESRLQDS